MSQNPNNQVSIPNLNELNIYEGGSLNQISISDLIGNEVAIRQLINAHNLKINEVQNATHKITSLQSEIDFHRTAPFVSILSFIVNLGGSTISAFAVNLLSSDHPPKFSNWLLIIGCILVFVGSLATILYPYARKFFNR